MTDPIAERCFAELSKWDFIADADAIGPAIWLRWFALYREQVWNDEWTSRGIGQPEGSWGFSGSNRREPMLEVLEYITREDPQSAWFDDRTTPQRETRDDIMRTSFAAAVAALRAQYGDDVGKWNWGAINILQIGSLSRQPDLARTGLPTVGTSYTVNPGSGGGTVGGGASWRMIVDLADPSRSIGVYPGGQSEHPASPFYADLMEPWAKGEYLPLHALGAADKLPESAKARKLTFAKP